PWHFLDSILWRVGIHAQQPASPSQRRRSIRRGRSVLHSVRRPALAPFLPQLLLWERPPLGAGRRNLMPTARSNRRFPNTPTHNSDLSPALAEESQQPCGHCPASFCNRRTDPSDKAGTLRCSRYAGRRVSSARPPTSVLEHWKLHPRSGPEEAKYPTSSL